MSALTYTVEDRLRQLIDAVTATDRKWKEMESATGIAAGSWVDFNRGKKRATAEMLEAVATVWPEYALWLATGEEDEEFGHLAPSRKDPECSAGPYLKSAILERQIARKILQAKYATDESSGPITEREKTVIEKFLPSAHQLIHPDDDTTGEFRAAATRRQIEQEKRRVEVSRLSQAERTLLQSLRGYPYVDKDAVLAAVHALLENAEKEKAVIGKGKKQIEEELQRGSKKG